MDNSQTPDQELTPVGLAIANERFRLIRRLGAGSFGEIYLAVDTENLEQVAVKLEQANSRHPQLVYESRVLRCIHQDGELFGFPTLKWVGQVSSVFVGMVISCLGPSLEDLFNFCERRFSLKSTLMIADQMIERMEMLHARHFIHRDVKPDNFLVGAGYGPYSGLIHVIDFGLSKRFRDPRTHQHIPFRDGKQLTGTARYVSISTHLGMEQARRDDLESLGYVFIYFLKGQLPWQGLRAKDKKQKYLKIMEKKLTTSSEVLCAGCPPEFRIYLDYCRALGYGEQPEYSYLRSLLQTIARREGILYDGVFDWMLRGPTPSPRWPQPLTPGDFQQHLQQRQQQQLQVQMQQQQVRRRLAGESLQLAAQGFPSGGPTGGQPPQPPSQLQQQQQQSAELQQQEQERQEQERQQGQQPPEEREEQPSREGGPSLDTQQHYPRFSSAQRMGHAATQSWPAQGAVHPVSDVTNVTRSNAEALRNPPGGSGGGGGGYAPQGPRPAVTSGWAAAPPGTVVWGAGTQGQVLPGTSGAGMQQQLLQRAAPSPRSSAHERSTGEATLGSLPLGGALRHPGAGGGPLMAFGQFSSRQHSLHSMESVHPEHGTVVQFPEKHAPPGVGGMYGGGAGPAGALLRAGAAGPRVMAVVGHPGPGAPRGDADLPASPHQPLPLTQYSTGQATLGPTASGPPSHPSPRLPPQAFALPFWSTGLGGGTESAAGSSEAADILLAAAASSGALPPMEVNGLPGFVAATMPADAVHASGLLAPSDPVVFVVTGTTAYEGRMIAVVEPRVTDGACTIVAALQEGSHVWYVVTEPSSPALPPELLHRVIVLQATTTPSAHTRASSSSSAHFGRQALAAPGAVAAVEAGGAVPLEEGCRVAIVGGAPTAAAADGAHPLEPTASVEAAGVLLAPVPPTAAAAGAVVVPHSAPELGAPEERATVPPAPAAAADAASPSGVRPPAAPAAAASTLELLSSPVPAPDAAAAPANWTPGEGTGAPLHGTAAPPATADGPSAGLFSPAQRVGATGRAGPSPRGGSGGAPHYAAAEAAQRSFGGHGSAVHQLARRAAQRASVPHYGGSGRELLGVDPDTPSFGVVSRRGAGPMRAPGSQPFDFGALHLRLSSSSLGSTTSSTFARSHGHVSAAVSSIGSVSSSVSSLHATGLAEGGGAGTAAHNPSGSESGTIQGARSYGSTAASNRDPTGRRRSSVSRHTAAGWSSTATTPSHVAGSNSSLSGGSSFVTAAVTPLARSTAGPREGVFPGGNAASVGAAAGAPRDSPTFMLRRDRSSDAATAGGVAAVRGYGPGGAVSRGGGTADLSRLRRPQGLAPLSPEELAALAAMGDDAEEATDVVRLSVGKGRGGATPPFRQSSSHSASGGGSG